MRMCGGSPWATMVVLPQFRGITRAFALGGTRCTHAQTGTWSGGQSHHIFQTPRKKTYSDRSHCVRHFTICAPSGCVEPAWRTLPVCGSMTISRWKSSGASGNPAISADASSGGSDTGKAAFASGGGLCGSRAIRAHLHRAIVPRADDGQRPPPRLALRLPAHQQYHAALHDMRMWPMIAGADGGHLQPTPEGQHRDRRLAGREGAYRATALATALTAPVAAHCEFPSPSARSGHSGVSSSDSSSLSVVWKRSLVSALMTMRTPASPVRSRF